MTAKSISILLGAVLSSVVLFTSGAFAKPPSPTKKRIEFTVTEKGFAPEKVSVEKGAPVTLAFVRKTDKTCAKEVIIEVGDGTKIEKKLPLDQTVEVAVTFAKTGQLRYACAMDMLGGIISVE